MGPDENTRVPKPFQPPAWMTAQVQKNIAKAKFTPEAFAEDVQKAKKLRDEAAANLTWLRGTRQERGLGSGSPDISAKTSQTTEARDSSKQQQTRPPLTLSSPKRVERMQPQVRPLPMMNPPKTSHPIEDTRREFHSQRHAERRAKKGKFRAEQAQPPLVKDIVIAREDVVGPMVAESSTTSVHRETVTALASPTNNVSLSSLSIGETTKYPVKIVLPKGLTAINNNCLEMKQLDKKRPPNLTALEALKNCIGRCEVEKSPVRLDTFFEELRDHVHRAEIKLDVNPYILKRARILTPENGLPRIFREEAIFPSDLKADAYQLYSRWYEGIFTQDILRGLILVKGKDRNGDRLDPTYRAKYLTDAKVYGANGLVLGQWWPTQLCTVRDGAHGAAQGGIFGAKDYGAYSIVLSGGGYDDTDAGDTIAYSGTEGKNYTPTDNTTHLITSARLANPIRVIRSAQLPRSNRFRPPHRPPLRWLVHGHRLRAGPSREGHVSLSLGEVCGPGAYSMRG